MKKGLILLFTLLISASLNAQTTLRENSTKNAVYGHIGINPSTLLTVGYQRYLADSVFNREIIVFSEISSSLFTPGPKDSEIKLGGIISIYEWNKFKIINSLNFSYGSAQSINFDSKKLAVGDELAIGFYGPKSFVATSIEFEHVYLNHLKHSDYFKDTYFSDVKDGWYKGLGGAFQFGIETGFTLKKKVDIHLELKVPFTEKFNSYMGSPFHLTLGGRYRF